jgi:hypothetical protein
MSRGANLLVDVRLLGLPVALYRQSAEHTDELRREFALILRSQSLDEVSIPTRLLRLIEELDARFGQFSAEPRGELAAALKRGDEWVDLIYRVPPEVKEATLVLGAQLDEADAFCLAGDHLLALATPPEPLAFRRWFLGEFVLQIEGAAPTPWRESAFFTAISESNSRIPE